MATRSAKQGSRTTRATAKAPRTKASVSRAKVDAPRAKVVGAKQERGRTKAAGPFPGMIMADILRPTFLHFLGVRGVEVATLDPARAVDEMIAYYDMARVEHYHPGKTDQLLFEAGTRADGKTHVTITRQLYSGAGFSRQLQLTLSYPKQVRLPTSLTLWSQRCASVSAFAKQVRAFVAAHRELSAPLNVKVSLARF